MNITGKTLIAGVMGWPVAHSRSPQLHGFWLKYYGIDGAYIPLPVDPKNLATALSALPAMGFRGANLTVPHKQAGFNFLDDVDSAAEHIGAVNTIIVGPGGRLRGINTDAYGFIENIKDGAPDLAFNAGKILILGAGGAARAVCVALLEAGATDIVLCNRSRARAEALAARLTASHAKIICADWASRTERLDGAKLVVNTTSLGMVGQPPLEIDLSALAGDAVVNDIVYTPLETQLLVQARAKGCIAIDGLGMLLHQARPAFAQWFGVDPAVTPELRRHVLTLNSDSMS